MFHWIQSQQIFIITAKWIAPATSCEWDQEYHSASKTQVGDRIFKLTPIHASVIYPFPEFAEFNESSTEFR